MKKILQPKQDILCKKRISCSCILSFQKKFGAEAPSLSAFGGEEHSNPPVTDTSATAYEDILAAATRADDVNSNLRIT
jgi:hypothetical protein